MERTIKLTFSGLSASSVEGKSATMHGDELVINGVKHGIVTKEFSEDSEEVTVTYKRLVTNELKSEIFSFAQELYSRFIGTWSHCLKVAWYAFRTWQLPNDGKREEDAREKRIEEWSKVDGENVVITLLVFAISLTVILAAFPVELVAFCMAAVVCGLFMEREYRGGSDFEERSQRDRCQ